MGLGVIKEFIMHFSDFAVAAEAAVLNQKECSTLPYEIGPDEPLPPVHFLHSLNT